LALRGICRPAAATMLDRWLIFKAFFVPVFQAEGSGPPPTSRRGRRRAVLSTKFSTSLESGALRRGNGALVRYVTAAATAIRSAPTARHNPRFLAAWPPSFDGKGHIAFDHTSRRLAHLAAADLLDRRPGTRHRTFLESAPRAGRADPLLDEVISVTRAHLPAAEVVNKLHASSVLGTVLAAGLRAVIAEPRITEAGLRAAFESAGRAAVHRLERYLNTLGTIASAAPLLGLMGTVIGMIEIFGSQAPSGSNPVMLAHGISIALYNTAFGLMIAIPTLMFYRYFRGLVDAYTLDMEQASDRLVPHLMRFAVPRSS
jgi:biopolymer transport protein ExbB